MTEPIISSRRLEAPRERVFSAFVDAEALARWWGPEGFTNDFEEFTPEPGGMWRFVMRSPGGDEFAMVKRFVEVLPNDRIVLDHVDPVHGFRMTMDFEEDCGGTLVTWRMDFESADEADRVRVFVVQANEQNLDRLAAELETSR